MWFFSVGPAGFGIVALLSNKGKLLVGSLGDTKSVTVIVPSEGAVNPGQPAKRLLCEDQAPMIAAKRLVSLLGR